MGGIADFAKGASGNCFARIALGSCPDAGNRTARQRAIAGEGKLAAGAPLAALIDNAADRIGIAGMAHAIEHDLRHGALPGFRFVAGFIVNRLGHALQRPRAIRATRLRKGNAARSRSVIAGMGGEIGLDRRADSSFFLRRECQRQWRAIFGLTDQFGEGPRLGQGYGHAAFGHGQARRTQGEKADHGDKGRSDRIGCAASRLRLLRHDAGQDEICADFGLGIFNRVGLVRWRRAQQSMLCPAPVHPTGQYCLASRHLIASLVRKSATFGLSESETKVTIIDG